MEVLEECAEREGTYKSVYNLSLKRHAFYFRDFRPDKAMHILFPYGFEDDFGPILLIGLEVIKGIYQLLIGSAILNFINSTIKGVILNLHQWLLSKRIAIDDLK